MKTIFTLTFLVITTLTSRAASSDGRITITNLGFYDVLIEIDGKRYDNGSKTVNIPNIAWGHYTVKIVRLPGRTKGGGSTEQEKLLHNNSIWVKPRQHVDIVITRSGKVMTDEMSMDDQQYQYGADTSIDNGYGNRYDDRMIYGDMGYYYTGNNWPLSRSAFNALRELMSSEASGTKRLDLAKEVIDQNYVTAMQVKLLADLFTSDDRALELAQYAYPKTINKNEFFVVYTRFLGRKSREKLSTFVKNYKETTQPANQ